MLLTTEARGRAVHILSGPYGTRLGEYPNIPPEHPELGSCANAAFSTEGLQAIGAIAAGYVDSGASLIITPTFGYRPHGFRAAKVSPRDATEATVGVCEAVLKAADAAGQNSLHDIEIVGDAGPILDCYRPESGQLTPNQLRAAHRKHMSNLKRGGITSVWGETISSPNDAIGLLSAAAVVDMPVRGISFYVVERGGRLVLPTDPDVGTPLEDIVPFLRKEFDFDQIGVNCTAPGLTVRAAQELKKLTNGGNVAAYANGISGEPDDNQDTVALHKRAGDERPAFFAAADQLLALGVSSLGGCCLVDEAVVRTLRSQATTYHPI